MLLTVVLVALLIWGVVVARWVARLPMRALWRVLLALVLLPVAGYWPIVNWYFGNFSVMELPRWLAIAAGGALGALLLLALLLVLRDLLGGVLRLLWPAAGRALVRSRAAGSVLALVALLLGAWGTWQAVKLPEVRAVEVVLPGLPPAFDGYRVVQLSDLHAGVINRAPWMAGVVERVNALAPDLIVITGDFQDGLVAARAAHVAPLARLASRDGVIGVPGNHEYYVNYGGWMQALRALGITLLENAHVLVARGGARVALVGLTDRQAGAFGQAMPDLAAATRGLPPGVERIVLSHRPDTARDVAASGAVLELAGHTHGGQIRGIDLLTQWANNGYVSGLYQVGRMWLYVSNGTGLWPGLPVRLGRPSEITLLTLRARAP